MRKVAASVIGGRVLSALVRSLGWVWLLVVWIGFGPSLIEELTQSAEVARVALFSLVGAGLVVRMVRPPLRRVRVESVGSGALGVAVQDSGVDGLEVPWPDRSQVAYHEAAHAVVASVVGGRVTRARIFNSLSGKVTEGFVAWSPDDGQPLVDQLWGQLQVSMAGHVSDLSRGRFGAGSWQDWEKSLILAAAISSCGQRPNGRGDVLDPMRLIVDARLEAERVLAEQAEWVGRIAEGLVERGSLTGVEVAALAPVVGVAP